MGTIIDILAILILIACFAVGYKKGFIKSVMGLVSVVVAIVISINLYSYPSAFLRENLIEPYFIDSASDTFSSLMNGGTEVIPPEKILSDKPDALISLADKYGISIDELKDYYENAIKSVSDTFDLDQISEQLSGFIVDSTTETVSNVLGFIVIFIASWIILNLLLKLLNFIFKLPVLKFANKILGGALGLIKSVLLVVLLINLAYQLASAWGQPTANPGNSTPVWSTEAVMSSNTYSIVDSVGLIF